MGTIIQWVVIGLCALCIPACLVILICNCILKKREEAQRGVEKKGKTGTNFEVGNNIADSDSDAEARSG